MKNSIYSVFKIWTLNVSLITLITLNYNQNWFIPPPYLLGKIISFPKHVLLWIYHLKRKSDERLNDMSNILKLISNFSQTKVTVTDDDVRCSWGCVMEVFHEIIGMIQDGGVYNVIYMGVPWRYTEFSLMLWRMFLDVLKHDFGYYEGCFLM